MSTCEVCGYIKSRCVCGTNPPEEEDYGDEALRLARKVGLLNGANAFTGVIDMDYKLVRLIAAARAESAHWPAPSASIDAAQPAQREAKRYHAMRDWYMREGLRAEIDPHGHIRQTTPSVVDSWADAAIAAAPSPITGEKE